MYQIFIITAVTDYQYYAKSIAYNICYFRQLRSVQILTVLYSTKVSGKQFINEIWPVVLWLFCTSQKSESIDV